MIALLLSPVGRWLGAFLLSLAVGYGLIALGHHRGYAQAEAKYLAAEAKEITRQAAVRAKALDEAVARELARAAENEALEEKVSRYEETLARGPDDRFRLGVGDVGELRKLQPPGSP